MDEIGLQVASSGSLLQLFIVYYKIAAVVTHFQDPQGCASVLCWLCELCGAYYFRKYFSQLLF